MCPRERYPVNATSVVTDMILCGCHSRVGDTDSARSVIYQQIGRNRSAATVIGNCSCSVQADRVGIHPVISTGQIDRDVVMMERRTRDADPGTCDGGRNSSLDSVEISEFPVHHVEAGRMGG